MLKRTVEDQRCQECKKHNWCCMTTLTGLRRCWLCWLEYYERRTA